MLRRLLASLLLLQLVAGCAGTIQTTPVPEEKTATDRSCAYFYFLWGTHAEYDQRFEEALEAYQKALICDPAAETIQKKVPVLLVRLGEVDKAVAWLKEYIKDHPDDTSQHLLLAHLLIQNKSRQEAIELYYRVLEQEPDNEGVLLRLGILHTQQQQFEQAEEIFKGLIDKNPELYLAYIYLARLHFMKGLFEKAEELYEKALVLNWSPELVYELVDLYSRDNNFKRVLELYNTILDNDPHVERAALGRIQVLLNTGNDEQALKELNDLKRWSAEHPPLDMAIAKLLLRLDKIDQAKQILLRLRADEEVGPEALYLLGLIAYQNNDNESAIAYLADIPPGSDDHAEGVYLHVRILRQEKKMDDAVALLNKVISDEEVSHPLFYALLSSLYQELGRDSASLATLIAGNIAFPENDLLLYEQALLLERLGKHEQAMTVMQQVLELEPDHAEALNFIGYSWADRNINLDQAYTYIKKAVDQEPENGYIRDSLGWILFRLGNLPQALVELNKALELEPNDPHIYEHLGDVLVAAEEYAKARSSYLKALEMFDTKEKVELIQEKLDALPAP